MAIGLCLQAGFFRQRFVGLFRAVENTSRVKMASFTSPERKPVSLLRWSGSCSSVTSGTQNVEWGWARVEQEGRRW